MIAGNLKDCEKYYSVHPRLKDAFEFIKKYEAEKPEGTKFEVDGKNLFAFTSDYVTRDLDDCEWETHDKYIDIQYVIEGEENGFTNIPHSIYWAIVTLTTVGYGDISPQTPLGQALASLIMIVGYGIIAVPTGIVTSELSRVKNEKVSTQSCPNCSAEGHDHDAKHCKHCGEEL